MNKRYAMQFVNG